MKIRNLIHLCVFVMMANFVVSCGDTAPAVMQPSPPPPPPPPSTSVVISGVFTYDLVPHDPATSGLNYGAIVQRPVKGVIMELLDRTGAILQTTTSSDTGAYSFTVASNTDVQLRAKAQMVRTGSPAWDVRVTDNVNGNALYTLVGSLTSSGTVDSTRDLLAASGWNGSSYASTRAAAPFAILAPINDALTQIAAVDPNVVFPPVEFRWSTQNRPVSGNLALGEIGTSFYSSGVIHILGAANVDTDEYDRHVVIHEWGHYFEDTLSRSDSIGGAHSEGDILDPRVAFGEGFGNALSGMITNDPNYIDSSGVGQASGFVIDLETNARTNPGWFAEGSVQAILFDIFDSTDDGVDNLSLGLGPIYNVLTSANYRNTTHFTTIFSFLTELSAENPGSSASITAIANGQSIFGSGVAGSGETNNGGVVASLPVYKTATVNGPGVEVCSTDQVGTMNRLSNIAYLQVAVSTAGNHTFTMTRTSGPTGSDPDFQIFRNGMAVGNATSGDVDREVFSAVLTPATYVIDAADFRNLDNAGNNDSSSCFNFSVSN